MSIELRPSSSSRPSPPLPSSLANFVPSFNFLSRSFALSFSFIVGASEAEAAAALPFAPFCSSAWGRTRRTRMGGGPTYRMSHPLVDWVDLILGYFGCSTLYLPGSARVAVQVGGTSWTKVNPTTQLSEQTARPPCTHIASKYNPD